VDYARGYLSELYASAITTDQAESLALTYLVATVDMVTESDSPTCGLRAETLIAAVARGMRQAWVEHHGPVRRSQP
jgi:hypothetical protein